MALSSSGDKVSSSRGSPKGRPVAFVRTRLGVLLACGNDPVERDGDAEGDLLMRVSPSLPSSSGFRFRLMVTGPGDGDSVKSEVS